MPRYFLNLRLRGDFIPDEQGVELPTDDAARTNALSCAKQMIAHDIMDGYPLSTALNGLIEVKDEIGRPILFMNFGEAAEISQNLK